jgi:hypothetical protein
MASPPRSCTLLAAEVLYGEQVRVERHWWNGKRTLSGRRDVYIFTDGQRWEVKAQIGGDAGRSKVQECPSHASAAILAGAWRGSGVGWLEIDVSRETPTQSRR